MKLTKMSQEELELLSYTKIAELYLKENKITLTTAELFKKVCDLLYMTEEEYQNNIADFFQSLSTTKEFVLLSDGKWDLKINHKIKVNIDELYEEKDEEVSDEEEEIEDSNEEIEDDYNSTADDDFADDDLADLTIVDEEDINKEEE